VSGRAAHVILGNEVRMDIAPPMARNQRSVSGLDPTCITQTENTVASRLRLLETLATLVTLTKANLNALDGQYDDTRKYLVKVTSRLAEITASLPGGRNRCLSSRARRLCQMFRETRPLKNVIGILKEPLIPLKR
jgi:hypothetical protein